MARYLMSIELAVNTASNWETALHLESIQMLVSDPVCDLWKGNFEDNGIVNLHACVYEVNARGAQDALDQWLAIFQNCEWVDNAQGICEKSLEMTNCTAAARESERLLVKFLRSLRQAVRH